MTLMLAIWCFCAGLISHNVRIFAPFLLASLLLRWLA